MPNNIITITKFRGAQQDRLHSFLQQFVQNIADRSRQYSRLYLRDQDHLEYGLLTNERGSLFIDGRGHGSHHPNASV